MTNSEKRAFLLEHYGTDYMPEDTKGIEFYHKCYNRGMDLIDADEYAALNTLLGYDIGNVAATKINYWLWSNDVETLELGCDNKSKNLIKQAAKETDIVLDFSKWINKPYDTYSYF